MTSDIFQFSRAARLYVQNAEIVERIRTSPDARAKLLYEEHRILIGEMRAETYLNLATFGEVLLERLSSYEWQRHKVRLRHKITYTVRSWSGGKIHTLRLEKEKGNWRAKGWLYLIFPIPEKILLIEDDTKLRGMFFDIVEKNQLGVSVGYDGPDNRKRDRITGLAKNQSFGMLKHVQDENWSMMSIPIDSEAPVESAMERLVELLRAIYEIENS